MILYKTVNAQLLLTLHLFPLFILQRYQNEAKIEPVDGLAMVKEMAEDMENMMGDKVDAIKVLNYNCFPLLFQILLCSLVTISNKKDLYSIQTLYYTALICRAFSLNASSINSSRNM